ncbi:TPA: hypothetical protein ACFU2Q_002263, partial [Neisseria subflava]
HEFFAFFAGVHNLKNIKLTVTGSNPLLVGADNNRNLYHWAGTLNRNRIDKLNIQLHRKLGIPGK